MLSAMSRPLSLPDDEVIDVSPPPRRHWRRWLLLALLILLIGAARGLTIYVSALWFGSLGYSSVYWYIFRSKIALFVVFAILSLLMLRGAFWLLERAFASHAFPANDFRE
jgi:uncharacterized membrane protein (UPF0182 family)